MQGPRIAEGKVVRLGPCVLRPVTGRAGGTTVPRQSPVKHQHRAEVDFCLGGHVILLRMRIQNAIGRDRRHRRERARVF